MRWADAEQGLAQGKDPESLQDQRAYGGSGGAGEECFQSITKLPRRFPVTNMLGWAHDR
jgi:hypothetical protein